MRERAVGQGYWFAAAGTALLIGACEGSVVVQPGDTSSGASSAAGGAATTGGASAAGGSGGSSENATPCDESLQAWVAANGDCKGGSPCYSVIQEAIDQAAEGTTIRVLPGKYGPANLKHVVEATKNLVCLRSVEGPAVTTLDGEGVGTVVRAGYKGALWIEGFTIRGAGPNGSDTLDGFGVGFGGWDKLRGWVVGNVFEDNVLGNGAFTLSSAQINPDLDVLIRGNVFRHNGAPNSQSMVMRIDFPGPKDDSGLLRIENNLLADNESSGILFFQMSTLTQGTGPLRIEIVNNTITRNKTGLAGPVQRAFVHNNIITGNVVDVASLGDASEGNILDNLLGVSPDFVGVGGNINGDPAFVAPDKGDYHLQPQSPANAAGTAALAPAVDLEGRSRDATHPDLGAFESP